MLRSRIQASLARFSSQQGLPDEDVEDDFLAPMGASAIDANLHQSRLSLHDLSNSSPPKGSTIRGTSFRGNPLASASSSSAKGRKPQTQSPPLRSFPHAAADKSSDVEVSGLRYTKDELLKHLDKERTKFETWKSSLQQAMNKELEYKAGIIHRLQAALRSCNVPMSVISEHLESTDLEASGVSSASKSEASLPESIAVPSFFGSDAASVETLRKELMAARDREEEALKRASKWELKAKDTLAQLQALQLTVAEEREGQAKELAKLKKRLGQAAVRSTTDGSKTPTNDVFVSQWRSMSVSGASPASPDNGEHALPLETAQASLLFRNTSFLCILL